MKGSAALLALLASMQVPAPAEGSPECRVAIERVEEGLVVCTEIEDLDPGKYSFGFDPSCESMVLLSAMATRLGNPPEELPSWAIDTLTGTDGYPLALFVAFPPGVRGSLSIREDLFDRLSIEGPSIVIEPPVPGAGMSVLVRDAPDILHWQGHGFFAEQEGDDLLFFADGPSGPLALSWVSDEEQLFDLLARSADSALSAEPPLASREAAIEAGAAGADPEAQVARLRTLMCNSFRISTPRSAGARFEARPLEEVFVTRIATPLEAAAVFVSVCRSLGFECDLVFAGGRDWGIPVASEWDRVLVALRTGPGDFLVEPSAVLVPAFYIPDASDLMVLPRGVQERHPLPRDFPSETCDESWVITRAGDFTLEASATEGLDAEIRRKLAGLGEAAMAAVVSTWAWRSGCTLEVDSVWTSDLYDLAEPASFGASGSLPPLTGGYLFLPALSWSGSGLGRTDRTWLMPADGALAPFGLSTETRGGSLALFDTLSSPPRRLARIGGPR